MVVIAVEIMEDGISRWHITQVEVDVEPHYTVHAVVNAASGLRKLRKVPWPSVKRRYEFNGKTIGPNTLVKTLWKATNGGCLRLVCLMTWCLSRHELALDGDLKLATLITDDMLWDEDQD